MFILRKIHTQTTQFLQANQEMLLSAPSASTLSYHSLFLQQHHSNSTWTSSIQSVFLFKIFSSVVVCFHAHPLGVPSFGTSSIQPHKPSYSSQHIHPSCIIRADLSDPIHLLKYDQSLLLEQYGQFHDSFITF